MADTIRFRCQSCGAGLTADGTVQFTECGYCGAAFHLPDAGTDPDLHAKTFQAGYDVENDPELLKALKWVKNRREGLILSDFGTSADFSIFHTNDKGLQFVGRLHNLEILDLHLCKVGGKGLKEIAGLPKLRKLSLCHTKIKDTDLSHITGLKNLEYLSLEMCNVTDACIDYLAEMPALEHVNVETTDITSEGVYRLAVLPNIRKLETGGLGMKIFPLFRAGVAEKCFELNDVNLTFEKLTDDDLFSLEAYSRIKNLDLRENAITGRGLKHIQAFDRLMSLKLSRNPITDAAIPFLTDLPRLRVLELEDTKVSEQEIDKLKKKRPEMRVLYSRRFVQ